MKGKPLCTFLISDAPSSTDTIPAHCKASDGDSREVMITCGPHPADHVLLHGGMHSSRIGGKRQRKCKSAQEQQQHQGYWYVFSVRV